MRSASITAPVPITGGQIVILLLVRFVLNTAFRLVYPLLTFFAAGFAVELRTASLLVTVQVVATLISPLGGLLADSRGERTTMIGGLVCFCVGAGVCVVAPGFGPFLAGYALIGCGSALFNPAMIAYASARSSYARRGQVLGIIELSWALAALVGVSTLVWLTQANGSARPAFMLLLGLGVLVLLLLLVGMPEVPRVHVAEKRRVLPGLAALKLTTVRAALLFLLAALCSMEMIFVLYAGWLERDFGATTAQLGLVFGALGIAEIGGSLGSAALVDRVGKRRAVLAGFATTGLLQALLPLSAGSWALFLPLFLLLMLSFEFAIVSTFPLLSELAPEARATVFAFGTTAIGSGRVLGSLIGPLLWLQLSFPAIGLLAAGLCLLGTAVCWRFVYEHH